MGRAGSPSHKDKNQFWSSGNMSQENKKVFRVILQVPNREALTQLLREHHLDLSCGGPRLQPDGTVTLEAYVGSDILNQLRQTMQMQLHQADSDIQVLEDSTQVSQERQTEVGRGNRFADNSMVVRGFGKKE
jgi:hypothetical protein